MAAVADVKLVNISINDVELQVPQGELVVEAVKRLGLEVPIFCYHSRMKPVGMCRMCLVEVGYLQKDGSVRRMPKPQTACTLPCTEGLQVYTDTQAVHNDRRGVLEFLLINHPLDCPICDRGGECPLQNNTLFYGPSTSRYVEIKRHAPKAYPLSQYVTLDLERCIQCGRCVRFTEEISGDAQLALRFRGARTQPGTFDLLNFESKFSGNVIEICPVGALTNRKYRFRARPWDLQTKPGVCTLCSNGCNVYMDYRANEIVRVNGRTNEAVNEEWTCDRGKFGHYAFNSAKRLTTPLVRKNDQLVGSDWADAYAAIAEAFRDGGSSVAALTGGALSNEDYFTLAKLFRTRFGSDNLDHRWERYLPSAESMTAETPAAIADYEAARSIFVVGTSLADSLPILFLRVRKAWLNFGAKVAVAHSARTEVDEFASASELVAPADLRTFLSGLRDGYPQSSTEKESETNAPGYKLRPFTGDGGQYNIVATRELYDGPDAEATVAELRAFASEVGAKLSIYARGANEEGAALLGVLPLANGKNTHEILTACAEGQIRSLWIVGVDPFAVHPDRSLVQRALENVEFLVVQDHTETEAMSYASVVLPMTAPIESEGSYTNLERRVQAFGPILPAKGSAKPAWRAITELSLRLKPESPKFHPHEVLEAIAAEVPEYVGASYDALKGEGFRLGQ
jgi:NADH-quinone oxidoreductase subunit G